MSKYPTFCSVFRSRSKAETYIFVEKNEDLSKVLPDELHSKLGAMEHVMDLLLSERKHLARTTPARVMAAIRSQGFYLQLPPADAHASQ